VLAGLLSSWSCRLIGLSGVSLPYRGGQVEVQIDAGLQSGLAGLAREHQVTLFMVLQAWVVYLFSRLCVRIFKIGLVILSSDSVSSICRGLYPYLPPEFVGYLFFFFCYNFMNEDH
jgi:hypothetical protein